MNLLVKLEPELMEILEMTINHYDAVLGLMQQVLGVTVRSTDLKDATAHYLNRNLGLSFVVMDGDRNLKIC